MPAHETAATTVRAAAPGEWSGVGRALGAAFQSDPVFSWLVPNARRRPTALHRYFTVEARHIALQYGASVLAAAPDGRTLGAALVFPPGRWQMPVRVLLGRGPDYLRTFARRTPRAAGLLSALERRHADVVDRPHYYVGYIGVVPAAQGRGLGRALLGPVTERCDAEGVPAYLEASSPDNVRLYERVGFVGVEEVRPLGSPPLVLMVREPA